MKNFKYRTRFSSNASINLGPWKEACASNKVFASSSLEDLRGILPDDEHIQDNPDLLYSAFNAAVVNLINANDHGIGTETALAVSKYFKDKHMNIDHDKYDIVGHIISQGFSSFGDNKSLEASDLEDTNDPFNIVLGSVVYRSARQWFSEILEESSNAKSDYHNVISASWEILYNEFDIVVGSKKIKDAEIISDPKQVAEISQYLRTEGGEGFMPDGTPIYTLIKGSDVRPSGCAFTNNPAAAVKGVLVANSAEEVNKPNETPTVIIQNTGTDNELIKAVAKEVATEVTEKVEKISSQIKKTNVKTNSMKLNKVEDIDNDFLKSAEASVVRDFITSEISKNSSDYMQQLQDKQSEIDTLEASKKELDTKIQEASDKIEELNSKIEELDGEIESRDKQEVFASRMEAIETAYELSDDQRKAVAAQIADLDDDQFAAWEDNFKLFAKVKEEEKKEEASVTDDLKKVKEEKAASVPNSIAPEEDNVGKMTRSLRTVVKIK